MRIRYRGAPHPYLFSGPSGNQLGPPPPPPFPGAAHVIIRGAFVKGAKGFIREFLWRPFSSVWAILTGLASLLAWFDVGVNWTSDERILVGIVAPLLALLFYVVWMAHCFYTSSTEVYRPLRVRRVLQGSHYFQGETIVILEPRVDISIGDVLTLYVREGYAESPICLLSVEMLTTEGVLQRNILQRLSNRPLTSYLKDETRHEQLRAKPGVTRSHLEGPQNDRHRSTT